MCANKSSGLQINGHDDTECLKAPKYFEAKFKLWGEGRAVANVFEVGVANQEKLLKNSTEFPAQADNHKHHDDDDDEKRNQRAQSGDRIKPVKSKRNWTRAEQSRAKQLPITAKGQLFLISFHLQRGHL